MDISPLVSQFNTWKKNAVPLGTPLTDATQEYERLQTEKIIVTGKRILKQYERTQTAVEELQQQLICLQQEWSELQSQTQQEMVLETGETLNMNLSKHPVLLKLWEQGKSLSAPQSETKKQTHQSPLPIPETTAEIQSSSQLYNHQFLSEESDELLTHLS